MSTILWRTYFLSKRWGEALHRGLSSVGLALVYFGFVVPWGILFQIWHGRRTWPSVEVRLEKDSHHFSSEHFDHPF